MAASAYNLNENYAKELEAVLMKFTRIDEQIKAETPAVEKPQVVEKKTEEVQMCSDTEVNIIECTKFSRFEASTLKSQDVTEGSSSFDDSDFGEENDAILADSEALSAFHDAPSTQNFGSFHGKFSLRKKKLTEHWRSHIQPLIWRSKWLELQIQKLGSQAQVYENELAEYKKKRRPQIEDPTLINGVMSVPISPVNSKSDILKRKKRRRVEEATDLAEYMSQHKLFSYYENKKSLADGPLKRSETRNPGKATQIVDVDIEFGLEDELSAVRHGDPDNSSELLLWKIFSMQSHVTKLKSKIDKVMGQNAGIFACLDDLTFPMPSSASTPNTGDGKEHTETGEFMMPENSFSSHGDTTHDGAASKRVVDGGVEGNAVVVKEEPDDFRSNYNGIATSKSIEPEKPRSSQQSKRAGSIARLTAPSSSKRKRGRRKAPGRKNRKSSG